MTYPEQDFIIDDDFLVTYERQILALPSRTPNGAFHPKKENAAEYNELQKSIVSALEQTGFLSNCLAVQPCTVRIMCGKQKDLDHTRPLATTKLHSDSWASHCWGIRRHHLSFINLKELAMISFYHWKIMMMV